MFWVPLGLSWITFRPNVILHSAVLVNGQRAREEKEEEEEEEEEEVGNRLRDILNALQGIGLFLGARTRARNSRREFIKRANIRLELHRKLHRIKQYDVG
ncbi:hypothetical protein M0804_012217 [Polistes exclamans]|nr:hypothetical protein M0804_012217 [Polistes exclamans]